MLSEIAAGGAAFHKVDIPGEVLSVTLVIFCSAKPFFVHGMVRWTRRAVERCTSSRRDYHPITARDIDLRARINNAAPRARVHNDGTYMWDTRGVYPARALLAEV